jgi:hypothetical protein
MACGCSFASFIDRDRRRRRRIPSTTQLPELQLNTVRLCCSRPRLAHGSTTITTTRRRRPKIIIYVPILYGHGSDTPSAIVFRVSLANNNNIIISSIYIYNTAFAAGHLIPYVRFVVRTHLYMG